MNVSNETKMRIRAINGTDKLLLSHHNQHHHY